MAIGERIRFFRNLKGMTQKLLGVQIGFPEKTADIRIAQYEAGSRRPKGDAIEDLAEIFEVSPKALTVPDIDSTVGLMHTLFALEDLYGLHATTVDGEAFLFIKAAGNEKAVKLQGALLDWGNQFSKMLSGRISKDEYDQWRYNYSEPIRFRRAKPVKVKRVILGGK